MNNSEKTIPRWIVPYVGFLALLSLSTSLMGYFMPQNIFLNTDIPFEAARPITFFYATRNMGILVLCLFALFTKDAKILLSVLLLRFVVELLDLIFTIQFGIGGFEPMTVVVIWTVVFLTPEFLGAWGLYRENFAGKS